MGRLRGFSGVHGFPLATLMAYLWSHVYCLGAWTVPIMQGCMPSCLWPDGDPPPEPDAKEV